jgi:hypothetical protein
VGRHDVTLRGAEIESARRLSTPAQRTRTRKEVGSELGAVTNEQPSDRTATRALSARVGRPQFVSGQVTSASRSRRRAVHGCGFDAKWWAFRHARLDHRCDAIARRLPRFIERASIPGAGVSERLGVQVLRPPPAKNCVRARYVGHGGRRCGASAVESPFRVSANKKRERGRQSRGTTRRFDA